MNKKFEVLPACAGVIPGYIYQDGSGNGFTRMRGGDPKSLL